MLTEHTPVPWRTEAVSDAVRVVADVGHKKVILARLRPPQLPESETAANALIMAAAPELLAALERMVLYGEIVAQEDSERGLRARESVQAARAAIRKAKARGEPEPDGGAR